MAADSAGKRYSVIQMGRPYTGPAHPALATSAERIANLKLYAFALASTDFGSGSGTQVRDGSTMRVGRGLLALRGRG
jgi:hypothetical protein